MADQAEDDQPGRIGQGIDPAGDVAREGAEVFIERAHLGERNDGQMRPERPRIRQAERLHPEMRRQLLGMDRPGKLGVAKKRIGGRQPIGRLSISQGGADLRSPDVHYFKPALTPGLIRFIVKTVEPMPEASMLIATAENAYIALSASLRN